MFSMQENTDLIGFAANKPKHLKQPFITCIGSLTAPSSYYLIIEGHVIPCGADLTVAFQNLYAAFYVFNVKFPDHIRPFYKFMDEFVFLKYQTNRPTPTNGLFASKLDSLRLKSCSDIV